MVGVACLGLTTLILHLQPTGYDPVRQVASDYAVGPYGIEMAVGFFLGGIGVVGLAQAIFFSTTRRSFRIGSIILSVAGVALFLLGAFPTDIEGAPPTVHGIIHSLLSLFIFSLGPVGMVLVSYGYGRRWFLITVLGFVTTSIFAVIMQLQFEATGLAERGLILLLLAWWFTASLHAFRASRLKV